MRQYIFFVAAAIALLGCSDDTNYPENPQWLNDKIATLATSTIPGMEISTYLWHNDYYYHFMNPISSCAFCEVYTYEGKLVSFSPEKFDDFMKNAKMERVVWRKK